MSIQLCDEITHIDLLKWKYSASKVQRGSSTSRAEFCVTNYLYFYQIYRKLETQDNVRDFMSSLSISNATEIPIRLSNSFRIHISKAKRLSLCVRVFSLSSMQFCLFIEPCPQWEFTCRALCIISPKSESSTQIKRLFYQNNNVIYTNHINRLP